MRNAIIVLVSLLVSSCATQLAYVDHDDMYVTRHYDRPTRSYVWTEVTSSYVQPSYYNPYFYQQVYVRPIVVAPEKNYQYGKRQERSSTTTPRVYGKPAPIGGLPRRGRN